MENEILTKLKKVLEESIDEESQVVYVMVQIRKLLERVGTNLNYSLLRFYCNWVLHPKINKLSVVRDTLNKIAEEHEKGDYGESGLDFINFNSLKKQMEAFFEEKNLPMDLLEEKEKWRKFKKLLVNIIKDCPLEFESGFKPIRIERFLLKRCEEDIHNGFRNFNTDWEYKLVNDDNIFQCSNTEIDREDKG